ncbi:MAG: hypothetical protein OEM27_04455 [Nitrospinota bacterium]|nr:hypothetical protein [Nitrospinota bacterium]
MPKECVECGHALEELVQEIRKMTAKNHLASDVAAKMEHELQEAIAEAKKDPQDLKLILEKLNGAKALVEGVASASGLLPNIAETITLVKSHLL